MICIEGIDPGAHGAVAFIWPEIAKMAIFDMPTSDEVTSWRTYTTTDGAELARIVRRHNPGVLYLEKVHSLPKDGAVGAFTFGEHNGTIKGVHQALGVKIERVTPQSWQAAMHASAKGKESKARAKSLFPACAHLITRVDKGEALMIALYGVLHQGHRMKARLTPLEAEDLSLLT